MASTGGPDRAARRWRVARPGCFRGRPRTRGWCPDHSAAVVATLVACALAGPSICRAGLGRVEAPFALRATWTDAVRDPGASTRDQRRARWLLAAGQADLYDGVGLGVSSIRAAVRMGRMTAGMDRDRIGAKVGSEERIGIDVQGGRFWRAAVRVYADRVTIGNDARSAVFGAMALSTPAWGATRVYAVVRGLRVRARFTPGTDVFAGIVVPRRMYGLRAELALRDGFDPSVSLAASWSAEPLRLVGQWDGATGSPGARMDICAGALTVGVVAFAHPALGISEGVSLCWRR